MIYQTEVPDSIGTVLFMSTSAAALSGALNGGCDSWARLNDSAGFPRNLDSLKRSG